MSCRILGPRIGKVVSRCAYVDVVRDYSSHQRFCYTPGIRMSAASRLCALAGARATPTFE